MVLPRVVARPVHSNVAGCTPFYIDRLLVRSVSHHGLIWTGRRGMKRCIVRLFTYVEVSIAS